MDPTLPLTSRDFDSNLQALIERVRLTAPGTWNSFHEGDLGTVLLEVIAYDASLLTFLADAQFQECFIPTLRRWESLTHFARLTGYSIQRNTSAAVDCHAIASISPTAPDYLLIRKGTAVTSRDGQVWEVDDNYQILPGSKTPVRVVSSYDTLRVQYNTESGVPVETGALVKIARGTTTAILVNDLGDRLPSSTGFGGSAGQILKLTATKTNTGFGAAPDITRREFAVVATGKLEFDQYDGSVLYLDREWDGSTDFVGRWVLEDRSIRLTQGETREDRFVAPETTESLSYTTVFYPVLSGTSNEFTASGILASAPDSGLQVFVDGAEWRETASLLFEGPSENAYEVVFDARDRATILFGNGVNGGIVPAGADIIVQYRTGGGRAGNVTQGSFDTSIPGTAVPASSNSPTVFITNPYTAASGGNDRESLEVAKSNLQKFVQANGRAVCGADYTSLAKLFTGKSGRVAHALAVLKRNAVPLETNLIWVYVWAAGVNGQTAIPSLAFKQELWSFLNQRKMITDEVTVLDGPVSRVPIHFHYKYATDQQEWNMKEAVRTAVFGVVSGMAPGESLFLSRLYEVMENVDGVEQVVFYNPASNTLPPIPNSLITNAVQEPLKSRLASAVLEGALSVDVNDPSYFSAGGVATFIEYGKTPTVAEIDHVSGSSLILKQPLLADYNTLDAAGRGCTIYSTDYIGVGWQYEKSVNVHVSYTTAFSTIDAMDNAIAVAIRQYFLHYVLPEQTLLASSIQYILSSISGVTSVSVSFGSYDGTAEAISSSQRERLVLGALTVNGVPQ